MVPLAAGFVALVRFPFSDLSQTSKPDADSAAVVPGPANFRRGPLQVTSYARPGKLFTASADLVERVVGALQPESVGDVIAAIVAILGGSRPPGETIG